MSACLVILFCGISLGYLLHLIGLFSPYWQVGDQEDTINDNIQRHSGIWISCITQLTGNSGCDDFNRSILGLPIHLIVGRLVGVFAAILGLVGLITLICGCDCCTKIPSRTKKILNLTGGCLSIASGIGLIAAMGFYAHTVLQNYYFGSDPFGRRRSGFNRDVFGWSLFVGWVGGAIQVVGGFLVEIYTYCCYHNYDEDNQPGFTYDSNGARNYAYRPEQPAPLYGKEYV